MTYIHVPTSYLLFNTRTHTFNSNSVSTPIPTPISVSQFLLIKDMTNNEPRLKETNETLSKSTLHKHDQNH